jgi:hypothetical protein
MDNFNEEFYCALNEAGILSLLPENEDKLKKFFTIVKSKSFSQGFDKGYEGALKWS